MPVTQYRTLTYIPSHDYNMYTVDHYNASTDSPKVNGKLSLQSNPHTFYHRQLEEVVRMGGASPLSMDATSGVFRDDVGLRTRLTNEALARFTGDVRKHNASLGVTLATYRQSSEMIVDRSRKIASAFEKADPEITKRVKRLNRRRIITEFDKARASDVLETMFGWAPLVQDIQDSLGALGRSPADLRWISRSREGDWSFSDKDGPDSYDVTMLDRGSGTARVTVSGRCRIDSQNTHLINRLGLLNLPGVAWDLVPWSFVVNMFTNMGQMVNSITDLVGVSVLDGSTTFSTTGKRTKTQLCGPLTPFGWANSLSANTVSERTKSRTLGIPTPQFMWRTPDLDVGLAAIAISLLVQRLQKFDRILKSTRY
jgi:hypothetical protein